MIINKFTDKFYDKIIGLSIEKVISAFLLITGLSVAAILKFTKTILGHIITLTVSQLVAIIIILLASGLFIVYLRKKLKSKQKFKEGTQVILSTNTFPIMSAGKFNFLKNKVLCSWAKDKEIKQQWINQNQLLEYKQPQEKQLLKNKIDFWDRYS